MILGQAGPDLYLMFNASTQAAAFTLPRPSNGGRWHLAMDTFHCTGKRNGSLTPAPHDLFEDGEETALENWGLRGRPAVQRDPGGEIPMMRGFTRRDFIKGALVTGAALALGGGLISGWLKRTASVLAALVPPVPHPLPADEHARVMAAARVDRTDDLNGMSALYLAGTHYEMGYQHGTLARDAIHAFRRAAYVYATDLIQQKMGWPRWLAQLLTRPLLLWQAAAYRDVIPSEYLEEAQGVADGAGVHRLEIVLVTAIWEMYPAGGCSEFVVTGGMTADGSLIHGFNYDLMAPEHAFINPHLTMVFYRPAGGVPFSTLNTVGSIGVNAGMNDAGLSIAWDNTYTRDDSLYEGIDLPVVPFIITLRRVLETCHSLEEGVQLVVDTLPRPLADVVIIGAAGEGGGRAVALETAGHLYATRLLENDAVWSTNRFHSAELAPYERRGDWRTMDEEEYARTFPRYIRYAALFERYRGQITPRLTVDILRDPYPREAEGEIYYRAEYHRTTICRRWTGFSLVMQPGQGLIWGSDGKLPAPQGYFLAFDQHNWQRRRDLDVPATGFRPALACAKAYLAGETDEAWTALMDALAADGETAPLVMMRSVLLRAHGDESHAQADIERVIERWGETDIGAVAQTWAADANSQDSDVPAVPCDELRTLPFPSAIAPWVALGHKREACTRQPVGNE
jgi:hypothetical protein